MQTCLGVIVRLSHESSPLLVQGGVGGWDLGSGGRDEAPLHDRKFVPCSQAVTGRAESSSCIC